MTAPHSSGAEPPLRPIGEDNLSGLGFPVYAPDADADPFFNGLDYPTATPTDNPHITALGSEERPGKHLLSGGVYVQPIPAAESSVRTRISESYYTQHIAPKPDSRTPKTVWPKIDLDYNADALADPNIVPFPSGPVPFDKLAFGGIRRRLFERKYLQKPAEKLDEAERKQNFYRSLGNEAFVAAGMTHDLPSGLEPVTVYDPKKPVITPANRAQRRHYKQVFGYHHGIIRKKHEPGHVDRLAPAFEDQKQIEFAQADLQKSHHKKVNRTALDISERLARIEADKEPVATQRYNELQRLIHLYNEDQKQPEEDRKYSADDFKAAVSEVKTYFRQVEKGISSRHQINTHRHSHADKKTTSRVKKETRSILAITDTGIAAGRRKRNIAKWERRVENAPAKAQKRIEKLRRKADRKDKYKRGGKKIITAPIKAPGKVVSKAKEILNRPPSTRMSAAFDRIDAFTERADQLMLRYNPIELTGRLLVAAAVTTEKVYDKAKTNKKINR